MAIIKTGAIFKTLRFGSVDSGDYGIYITGAAVYNAPERAVEKVSVPGRNGAILIDMGHFENVTVSYPAGTFAASQGEFSANIGAFRNAVLSQLGYQRLEDDYNPNEYRMANASAGVEVEPSNNGIAGEFELVFDCKPQRFLVSGETETTIAASGDTITNPTRFESQPLVVVEGYGNIGFNGYEMEVYNTEVGRVTISDALSNVGKSVTQRAETVTHEISYNPSAFNAGDQITINNPIFYALLSRISGITDMNLTGSGYSDVVIGAAKPGPWALFVKFPTITLTVGTDASITYTYTGNFKVSYTEPGAGSVSSSVIVNSTYPGFVNIEHDAANGKITFTWRIFDPKAYLPLQSFGWDVSFVMSVDSIIGVSTFNPVSGSVYIDTEIGEAYIIQGGEPVSVNNSVSIGAELPRLAPGANTVTFDNTFNSVKITGRWWQL